MRYVREPATVQVTSFPYESLFAVVWLTSLPQEKDFQGELSDESGGAIEDLDERSGQQQKQHP